MPAIRHPLLALAALGAAIAAPVAAAAPSGAAFTTDVAGAAVNENHYSSVLDVYLNGGPPCNASRRSSSLPDGWYAFRVTDPGGRVDMTAAEPVAERMFRVKSGAVVESADPGDHPLAPTACGKVMRVGPFAADSRNGEYTLWIVPATPGRAVSFANCNAKKDNFRVDGGGVVVPPPPPPTTTDEEPPPPPPPPTTTDEEPPPPPPPPTTTDEEPPPPPPDDPGVFFALSDGSVPEGQALHRPAPAYGPSETTPAPPKRVAPKVAYVLHGVLRSTGDGTITVRVRSANAHARKALGRSRVVTLALHETAVITRRGTRGAADLDDLVAGDRVTARWTAPARASRDALLVRRLTALPAPARR